MLDTFERVILERNQLEDLYGDPQEMNEGCGKEWSKVENSVATKELKTVGLSS